MIYLPREFSYICIGCGADMREGHCLADGFVFCDKCCEAIEVAVAMEDPENLRWLSDDVPDSLKDHAEDWIDPNEV